MSPPVPDLRGHGGDQALLRDDRAQIVLEPARAVGVADDARDLDLVHREDHAARPAPAPELERRLSHVLDPEATAAEHCRHEAESAPDPSQRVDRLAGNRASLSTSSA